MKACASDPPLHDVRRSTQESLKRAKKLTRATFVFTGLLTGLTLYPKAEAVSHKQAISLLEPLDYHLAFYGIFPCGLRFIYSFFSPQYRRIKSFALFG
jgi:hypothetical protein